MSVVYGTVHDSCTDCKKSMKNCTFFCVDSIMNFSQGGDREFLINNEKTGGGLHMYDAFSRMENLLGTKGVKRLGSAKIAVFGIGGIGQYVVEALARCGVGSLTLVDNEDIFFKTVKASFGQRRKTLLLI